MLIAIDSLSALRIKPWWRCKNLESTSWTTWSTNRHRDHINFVVVTYGLVRVASFITTISLYVGGMWFCCSVSNSLSNHITNPHPQGVPKRTCCCLERTLSKCEYLLSLQIFNGNHITLHYTRDWHYTQDWGAYLVYQSLLIQSRVSLSIFIPNTWKTLGSGNYVYMYSNIAAPFSPFSQRHAIGCEKFQTN